MKKYSDKKKDTKRKETTKYSTNITTNVCKKFAILPFPWWNCKTIMYTALAGVLLNYFHLVHDTLCFLVIINCYLLPPAEIHQLVYIYFANSAITIRWKITYHSHRLVVSCCSWRIGSIFLLSFFKLFFCFTEIRSCTRAWAVKS